MILEYHRPETTEEALALLGRKTPKTVPLGGGTVLSAASEEAVAVVDLQALRLDRVERKGNTLEMGATLRLQKLLETPELPPALSKAIRHEATYNLRQAATVAGTLVSADGRSPFATSILALDAQLMLLPGEETVGLGDLLPLRGERLNRRLITKISAPMNVALAYEYVSRSPADLPIVCVAVGQWPSGRTRVAVGGFGKAPMMAMDGQGAEGAVEAAVNACSQAEDVWATAEYRVEAVRTLTRRCLDEIGK